MNKKKILCLKTASTNAEVDERRRTLQNIYSIDSTVKNTQAPVAILRRDSITSDQKGTLACALPWGFGYGWSTLSNGIWGGGKLRLCIHICFKVELFLITKLLSTHMVTGR